MNGAANSSEARTRRPRCNQVLMILNNRIETVDLIREEIHPPVGDLQNEPLELAIVRWHGLEICVALECVVFLGKLPLEPQWMQKARAKIEKELVSTFRSNVKHTTRADRDENRAAKRTARKGRRHIKQQ